MSLFFIPMAFMAVVFFVLFAVVFVFIAYNIYGAVTGRGRGPFNRFRSGRPFIPFDVNDHSVRERRDIMGNEEQMPGHHHHHAHFPAEQPSHLHQHHHHQHDASQQHHIHHQHHDMSPPPAPTFDAGSGHHHH